ncbi:peptidase M48 [Roseateles chitinivorans]|uniref:Peptidase M48 n=1 Tax=Roseateles chitinivorans TaxID=2917965 RepID=A0A2G9CEQ5_9BURK|nr:M48 family metallopeptidase [Roseateles chitinivorans]PIM54802.1 peptidase M48 [Roseateles chitinivorans]
MVDADFLPDADPQLPGAPAGFGHCDCRHCGAARTPAHPARRLFTGLLAAGGVAALTPAWAQEGVDVGKQSRFTKLVSAEQVEAAAQQQYTQMMRQAQAQKALGPANHPQVVRLRAIAQRIIPFAAAWNPRAQQWRWEVNLIGSRELNAFCMPGGKIAFYFGILQQLQLSDDEVAMIMGHEMAHALREHARERMGKNMATNGAIELGAALLGLGNMGRGIANIGGQLLSLTFSREDESEADLVGMELAARAGYNPQAGVTLWQKMGQASKGAPPQFLSTHPAGPTRIRDIERTLPRVQGLYARAPKPEQRFQPPAPAKS